MTIRTLLRRSAAPVVAALAISALAAVPAEAAVGTVSKPSLYQASTKSPGIKVSWKAVSKATGYTVQWSTSSTFKSVGSKSPGKVTSYTVGGLAQGKKYYFRVRAVAGKSVGKWSSAVAKTRQTNTLLGVPTGYTVKQDGTDLVISWKRPASRNTDNAIKYQVFAADYRQVSYTGKVYDTKGARDPYFASGSVTTSSSTPAARVKAPTTTANGFGRSVYLQVRSLNSNGSYKSDGLDANSRKAYGVVPASPDATDGIEVVPGCTTLVVRWKGAIPARATAIEARVSTLDPTPVVKTFRPASAAGKPYGPTESVTANGLSPNTDYKVDARAINADKTSTAWSNVVDTSTVECDPASIKVGSYNIVSNKVTSIPAWSTRAPLVAGVIHDSGAAVVGLQEARYGSADPDDQQLNILLSELGDNWAAEDSGSGAFRAGVHLVYDKDVVEPVGDAKGVNPGVEMFKEYAVGQIFQIKGTTTRFVAIALHTDSTYTGPDPDEYWGMQAKDAFGLVDKLKTAQSITDDLPVVLAADANLARSEWKDTKVRRALGLNLSDTEYAEPGKTLENVNSQNGYDQGPHKDEAGVNVDGIFYAGPASPSDWTMMLPDYDRSTGYFGSSPLPSDHNMLVTTFGFKLGL